MLYNNIGGQRVFGSTGEPEIFWALDIGQRKPTLQIQFLHPQNQPKFWTCQLLVDTGADVTIISSTDWPSGWPLVNPAHGLVGVGGTSTTMQSAVTLKCKNPDGYVCSVRPYIAPIPVNLLGRDVLGQMSCTIVSNPKHFVERPLKSDQPLN